jgi:hypothetical protein
MHIDSHGIPNVTSPETEYMMECSLFHGARYNTQLRLIGFEPRLDNSFAVEIATHVAKP